MQPKNARASATVSTPIPCNLQEYKFKRTTEIINGPIPSKEKKNTRKASNRVFGTFSSLPILGILVVETMKAVCDDDGDKILLLLLFGCRTWLAIFVALFVCFTMGRRERKAETLLLIAMKKSQISRLNLDIM